MTEEREWQTRRDRINKKLTSLDPPWTIVKHKDNLNASSLICHAVEEYPTANGPADYALFVKGKLLGVIEAKKVGVGAYNALKQAKRYSRECKTVKATGTAVRCRFCIRLTGSRFISSMSA